MLRKCLIEENICPRVLWGRPTMLWTTDNTMGTDCHWQEQFKTPATGDSGDGESTMQLTVDPRKTRNYDKTKLWLEALWSSGRTSNLLKTLAVVIWPKPGTDDLHTSILKKAQRLYAGSGHLTGPRCTWFAQVLTLFELPPPTSHRTDARPLLRSLHWLPVRQRVTYKVVLLTHKVRATATPAYLSDLIQTHVPIRTLHSSGAPLLAVSRTRTELAQRAFSVATPSMWNSLPADIRLCESVPLF